VLGLTAYDSLTPPSRRWVVPWLLVAGLAVSPSVTWLSHELFPGPGYAFRHTQPGSTTPIGYHPCRPVEFVVYDVPAPDGVEGLLDEAIAAVSEASGLTFAYLGPAENPAAQNPSDPDSSQEPALIGWATPEDVDRLEGRTAGVGGSSTWAWDAELAQFVYIGGVVILDAPALAEMLEREDGRDLVRAVITHELGHLLGLDHVKDPDQLMHDENVGNTELGAGDRAGLAMLGADRCRDADLEP